MNFTLTPRAFQPQKASPDSAGYDLLIPEDTLVIPGRQVIPTGISIALPPSHKAAILPRSGHSSKGIEGYLAIWRKTDTKIVGKEESSHLLVAPAEPIRFNADVLIGTVDADYRGPIGIIIHSHEHFMLPRGSRIAQLVISRIENQLEWTQVETLDETTRGAGGFGHSGTQ